MITFIVHTLNRNPALRLIQMGRGLLPEMRLETYQQAFRRLSVPPGTLVFSDFEFLDGFGLTLAARMADAALRQDPQTRVLNHPARAMERFALLRRLRQLGLNRTEVTRLEGGDRPTRYPVFLRLEDGCDGPEGGLIADAEALEQVLQTAGRPLKRRIAVSYEGEPDAAGLYRKYGAFRIGDAIVPQHILRGRGWMVKAAASQVDAAFAAEELAFVRDNPDRDALLRVCDAGHLQFGRVDYDRRADGLVVYEINPNPTFPDLRESGDQRAARRGLIAGMLRDAFVGIDTPVTGRARIAFTPEPNLRRYVQMDRWGAAARLWTRLRLAIRDRRTEGDP